MKTILVIEDEPFIRESIRDVLELEGYQAITAANGSIGVKLALEQLPDLILCDVAMPEMDGYEVLKALQANQGTNAIPFVFLTARTTKADLRHGMDLGADDYLAKPCTATELLSAITSRFEKQTILQTRSAEQLKSLRDSISQSLPHELYTPLNGILGFSELLFHEYETIERSEIQEIGEAIYTSALRLHHLMKNFLLYSKLELMAHNPAQIEALQAESLTYPDTIVQSTVRQVAQQVNRLEDIQLSLQFDSQVHPINSSQINSLSTQPSQIVSLKISDCHLQKLIGELVDNACKFSEPGTPVRIETSCQADCFLLTISNQGRGMTAEQIASLGAYMQFDRKNYEQQGSGLGLTIAKRIAELYGGSLQIKSIPGEWTTIQIRLLLTQC